MHGLRQVVGESAAVVLLLGGVIATAQWLLRRLYGEDPGADTDFQPREDRSCHQPR